jgi:hypothetical protein
LSSKINFALLRKMWLCSPATPPGTTCPSGQPKAATVNPSPFQNPGSLSEVEWREVVIRSGVSFVVLSFFFLTFLFIF